MVLYVPGTEETDPKKQNMSLQLIGAATSTNATNITTNTASIASNTSAITALQALVPLTSITASLGADVLLNNTANYFDGPSVAQGTSGTWYASASVTVQDTGGAVVQYFAKLWDGATVISSGTVLVSSSTGQLPQICLSGVITSPAGNIRLSVRDSTFTTGKILFNQSGNSKDSTITAIRLA